MHCSVECYLGRDESRRYSSCGIDVFDGYCGATVDTARHLLRRADVVYGP